MQEDHISNQGSLRSIQDNPALFDALAGTQRQQFQIQKEPQAQCSRWLRLIVCLPIFGLTALVSNAYNKSHWRDQIRDFFFQLTAGANNQIRSNWSLGRGVIISTSVVIDVNLIALLIYWFIHVRNSRIIVTTPSFYLFRALIQGFFLLPFPETYYLQDPGFPTIACTYRKTADFFFSGHVGFLTMLTFEWVINKQYFWLFLNIIAIIYISITMVMIRIHYSIDILFGFIVGHYIWELANYYHPYVDRFFARFYARILSNLVEKSETAKQKKKYIEKL